MQETAKRKYKKISLGNVALMLIVTTLIGQGLGFLRTVMINHNFSAEDVGAYFAAFNIPDLFFFTLAAGAMGVAFMPVLAERLHKGDRRGMWELTASLINLLSLVMIGVAIFILLFARPLLHHIVAPKLNAEELNNAVFIMRCAAFTPLFFTLSGILTSVQQTLGRFFFYAIAPLVYNMAIIVSVFVFHHTSLGVKGLGVGAFIGGIGQLLVICVGLFGTNFHWSRGIMWRSADFRTVLRQLPPRSLDQGMDQVQAVVETHLASKISTATIAYYNNAYTLQTAPVLLLGTAISTAIFPQFTHRMAQGRTDLFRRDFLRTLRLLIWITLPVVIVSYFCRGYLARIIFGDSAPTIALIFGYLTVAILFRTLYTLISRWFYAQKDTKTPLFVSVFTIGLNIALAVTLARPTSQGGYGVAGLALSQSIVAMVEVLILSAIMLIRDHKLFDAAFWGGCVRIVSVTGFSLIAGYIAVSYLPLGARDVGFFTLGGKLAIIAGTTFVTHILISGLFGLDEARPIFIWIKRAVLRPPTVKLPY